jgi:uncharacterized protein (TIGR02246 family)
MTRRTIAVAALGLMLVACGGVQDKKFSKADSDSIKRRTQELVAALNAKDAGKAAQFYGATATFMPPHEATVHGRDSVQLYYQTLVEAGVADVTMEPKDVGGEGPVAYADGTYSMTLKGKNGGQRRDRGKYLFVLRNTGGQWRCEYSIWNSDLPQAEVGDQ